MELKIFTEQEKQSLCENAIDIVYEAGKITNRYFKKNLITGHTILLKGSRKINLEKVIPIL